MTTRLQEIALTNFGPYRGTQTVALDGRVVVIHGPNMSGKTSLFNAIRWALYGVIGDRVGQPILRRNIVNKDAAKANDWKASVLLRFEIGPNKYELTRAIQPRDPTVSPRLDADFQEKVFLQKDGYILDQADVAPEINRLLPEQISRFFLFDGEQLDEYEKLLADKDEQAQTIRDSIEDILGVPALANAIADLRINHKDAAKRQQGLARKDQAAKVFATIAANLDAEIEGLDADVVDLKGQRDQLHGRQTELSERLRLTAAIESEMDRLALLEAQLKQLDVEQDALLQERRLKLAEAWKDLLIPKVQARLRELEDELEKRARLSRQVTELRTRLALVEEIQARGRCPVCESQIDREASKWESERARLEEELGRLQAGSRDQGPLLDSIRRLRSLQAASVTESIRLIDRRLLDIRVQRADHTLKVDEIADRLKGHNDAEVARTRRDYEDVTKEIGVLENTIKAREAEVADKQLQAEQNRDKISRFGGPELERLNREVRTYDNLIAVFQGAIVELRDALRAKIERDASEIFLQLTTDKTYTGLRISPTYALTIVDSDGDEVPVRSAGAEQVVALSLIGALNRNAVRSGPIVMDTPFGRLDPTHRANVLRFIPTMADQVTLLVHAGEVERDRDLTAIAPLIGREYAILKRSSNQSEIQVLE